MRHVDEAVGRPVERRLQHFAERLRHRRRPRSAAIRRAQATAPRALRLRPPARARDGSSAPNAIPQATRAASPPRKMKRAAGGASANANRGPGGRARPSSGERSCERSVSH